MSLILHDNVLEGVTPTASNAATDYDGVNVNNWLLYNSWKPGVVGTQDLVFDLTTAKSVDTLCFYGHNLASQACSVTLTYSTDNSSFTDAVAVFAVQSDGVIYKSFTTQSKRYWRLRVTNTTIDALISVVAMGAATVLPSAQYDGFKPALWNEEKNINSVAVNGNFLGRSVKPIPGKMKIEQKNVTDAFVRGDWASFVAHAKGLPFFFSWDETNYPDEIVYAWTDKAIPQARYVITSLLTVDMMINTLR